MTANPVDLELRHPRGRTQIRIGAGALAEPGAELLTSLSGRTCFVVTSAQVRELHERRLSPLLESCRQRQVLEVPVGEGAKDLEIAADLWRRMVRGGGKRDSVVIAFGGGTVGDLAGFVAGGFLRGIDYVQIPTTLLAQVDAAIGGKTAVNLPEGKNTIGLFHHPRAVICDTEMLSTLDPAELRSGLFEVLKIGAIRAAELLGVLERVLPELLARDAHALAPVVAAAVAAKAEIVEADPEEGDLRRLLNFGHTLGHALESLSGYSGLRHGEAVGYGMLFALELARERGLEARVAERLVALIRKIGLPPLPRASV